MAMKYAFNVWGYSSFPCWLPSYTLDETIRRVAAIGYDGIEIGCAAPHAWPSYLSAARRRELRTLMQDVGLRPVSLLPAPGGGPGCNAASPLPEERAFAAAQYKEVVDLAADFGAELVLYIGGWQIFGTSREQAWDWSRACLADVADHAGKRGVTIAIEPTPADSNLIESADDALELMRAVDRRNVKTMFDTYHALYRSEVAADYVRVLGDSLAHVHAADVDRKAPQAGPIDWTGLLQALKDGGFAGHVTMEAGFTSRAVDPDLVARDSLAYLRSVEAGLT